MKLNKIARGSPREPVFSARCLIGMLISTSPPTSVAKTGKISIGRLLQ